MNSYSEHCETLWREWIASTIEFTPSIRERFLVDHAIEPYVLYGATRNPLYVLLTNPGGGLKEQQRQTILDGNSCVQPNDSYTDAATKFGKFYEGRLAGQAATRIRKMKDLAKCMGKDSVIQLECIPLHSKSLPSKSQILDFVDRDDTLRAYIEQLRRFMRNKPVLAVAAASPLTSLTLSTIANSKWLGWLANLVGINLNQADLHPTARKNRKTTAALIVPKRSKEPKGIHVMMGTNGLPRPKSLQLIANHL